MEWGSVEYFKEHFFKTASIMSKEVAFAQCSIAILKSSQITQDDEIKDGSETARYFANLLKAYHPTLMEKLFLVEMCDVMTHTYVRAGIYEEVLSETQEEALLSDKHSVRVTPIEEIDGYRIIVTK